jgi:RecB family exonuclease
MQQSNTLHIFSTSRALRVALESLKSKDQILPVFMTIGDFEQRSTIVLDRIFIDDESRVLLMQEAIDFEEFNKLKIPVEFLSFLKNSKFIFGFLDELAQEYVDIEDLHSSDTYVEFSEHLSILESVKINYTKLLDRYNFVDKMTLPELFTLNREFIVEFSTIYLDLEGYLSNFEFKLFKEVSQLTNLIIRLTTTEFNQKIIDKFRTFGLDLELDHFYEIDFTNRIVLNKRVLKSLNTTIEVESFIQPTMQVAFIKKNVAKLLQDGLKPQEIVVVLPDKSYAPNIQNFDDEHNFNFAFGFSFTTTTIYKKIEAIYLYLSEKSYQNRDRLKRYFSDFNALKEHISTWHSKKSIEEIESIFEFLKFEDDGEAQQIFDSEIYLFRKILPSLIEYPFSKILYLLLHRLSLYSIDDVRGGKITVLEILETRGVSFKGVILVNFNEGLVPKKSKKDMFISSKIRYLVNLPTSIDRENLQKFYYKNLISRANRVYISYVDSEQSVKSRFLDELDLDYEIKKYSPKSYHNILFNSIVKDRDIDQDDITIEYDFTKVELSASRLKNFLECKRRYYYKYIQNIKDHEIPNSEIKAQDIGNILHKALYRVYSSSDHFLDETKLVQKLQDYLYCEASGDLVLKFHMDLWLKRLKEFAKKEIVRFRDGFRVYSLEKTLTINYQGLILTGQIDRIDVRDNRLSIIDYKSGKLPKTTKKTIHNSVDFQLQFYYHLASSIKEVYGVYYYDLTNQTLVEDQFFEDKLSILDAKLEELKKPIHRFNMCEDSKKCLYCPYKTMCGRD